MLIFKFLPFSTVLRFQISPFLDTLRWDSDGSRITEFQTEATPKDYRITEFQTEAVKKITGLPNFKLRDYRITQFQKRLPNFFVRSKSRTPPPSPDKKWCRNRFWDHKLSTYKLSLDRFRWQRVNWQRHYRWKRSEMLVLVSRAVFDASVTHKTMFVIPNTFYF